jgi:Subtilase family
MRVLRSIGLLAVSLTAVIPPSLHAQAPAVRRRIERAADLPAHTYAVPSTASALLGDSARFAVLIGELEVDLQSDLTAYDIADRATLKSYYGTLRDLALERGRYSVALAYRDSVRAIEDKPGLRYTAGLGLPALVAMRQAPADSAGSVFRARFQRELDALPWDTVQAEIRSMKGFLDITSVNQVLGRVHLNIDPAAQNGEISRELAQQLVAARVTLDVWLPRHQEMEEVLGATVAAHTTVKPDIWAARDMTLDGRAGLTPVLIGIWDSGVDPAVYRDRLYTNPREVPGNGRDDDGDGFVDDVHGTAFDLTSNPTTGELPPLAFHGGSEAEYRGYVRGFLDMQAGIESPEGSALKQKLAGTPQDRFRDLIEDLNQYLNYAHGTHVAGIAVRGNLAARVYVARTTFDYHVPQMTPTIALTEASVNEARVTIAGIQRAGVRVVNMSWGGDPKFFEDALEANHAGGTPEERHALARRMFDIWAGGLHDALASAPEVLFVAAAGNSDNDNAFSEFVPASFNLPNVITVGAVDAAGDEAAFTSYGKVDVYANGYQVASTIPGGTIQRLSGTSMATPQVVNLAAKLLALKPALPVAELRRVILEGADDRTIGPGKRIRLLNPARSFELVGLGH